MKRSAVPSSDPTYVLSCTVQLPSLEMLRSYLESRHWKFRPTKIEGLSVYILSPFGGDEIGIVLPDEATSETQWQRRVEMALQTLVSVETFADPDIDARPRPTGDLAVEIIVEAERNGERTAPHA